MKIGTWLFTLIEPALGRILAALGFSVVTITGMDVIFKELQTRLVALSGGVSADMFNLFLLAGSGQGMAIIVGAISTKLLLWQIQQSTKILGINPS
jgi:hypothetical protein